MKHRLKKSKQSHICTKNNATFYLFYLFFHSDDEEVEMDEDEETRILLEKEFDDFYEDQVHKSAGPVVFVSKMLGMLPAIWTDDDTENDNECKSYFNLYTFLIFAGKLRRPWLIRVFLFIMEKNIISFHNGMTFCFSLMHFEL